MSALDQPLLSAGAGHSAQDGMDNNVLTQIRTVLTNAGITADMINLPPAHHGKAATSITTFSSSANDGNSIPDVEKGNVKKSRYKFLQKLSDRAESRGEDFDKYYPLVEGTLCLLCDV